MRSADDIRRLFKNAELGIGPEADERVFEEMLKARQKVTENLPALPESVWRVIMKSPLTKLAVAAVVVIACSVGLSLWRTTGSGITLADVLAQIEKVSAYQHQGNSTLTNLTEPNAPLWNLHYTILRSPKHGYKKTMPPGDPNGTVEYFSMQENALFLVRPKEKEYERMDLPSDDARMTSMAQKQYDYYADGIVKKILECKYESTGRSIVDGVEVEGFRTTDPNYTSQKRPTQVDVRIWVDVKTRLLVRSEERLTSGQTIWDLTTHDYHWDIPVEASDFKPVIPGGYTRMEKDVFYEFAKMKDITEENVIQGLRLYADLSGRYPNNVTWMPESQYQWSVFEKSETPAARRLREELKGLTEEEKANRLREALMPMRRINGFYYELRRQKKDRAYYGDTVTPKDNDKVLMRWKVSDNEYRVVYGDLHAETVTPERLAELEKGLPK